MLQSRYQETAQSLVKFQFFEIYVGSVTHVQSFYFNFPKSCILLMGFMLPLLKYNNMHKVKIKGILTGHTIAMVTP